MAEPIQFPVSAADHHAAKVYVAVTVPLFALALTTIVARIAFKLRANPRLNVDDYLILMGFALATVEWALLMTAIAWCTDSSRSFASQAVFVRTIKLGVIAVPVWSFSIGFIKLSVCCLLLRFQDNKSWRMVIYVVMGAVTCVSVASGFFSAFDCLPLSAIWDPTVVGAKCVSTKHVRFMSNFVGAFSILTDLILSLFPLTFIVKLRRPFVEKILILVLMAIGLTAAAASITKAVYINQWVNNRDGFYVGFILSTLSIVEILIGTTAACLPCLKSTIQGILTSWGFDFSRDPSAPPPQFFQSIGQVLTPHNAETKTCVAEEIERKESAHTDSSKSSGAEKGDVQV